MRAAVTRLQELDVLRGIAIFGMVLSGSIAFGGLLPAWMYHAQVPPPSHQFDPTRAGITWVDLVFPFFLFCMGVAMPLSFQPQLERGISRLRLMMVAGRRFFQLLFFALFSQHMKAWVLSSNPSLFDQFLSICSFFLLFGQLFDFEKLGDWVGLKWVKPISYILAGLLLYQLPFYTEKGFDLYRSDIIIVVLANMAFFGSLIYIFTVQHPIWRGAILVVVGSVILSAREPGEHAVKYFFNFHSFGGFAFDWAYKFYFLKYLFIVIPGTWAGDLFLLHKKEVVQKIKPSHRLWSIGSLVLLILLLSLLFIRNQVLLSWAVLLGLLIIACFRTRLFKNSSLTTSLTRYGLFFLLVGLILEPYEGGIKKDPSTFSYYFITTGYSYLVLLVIKDFIGIKWVSPLWNFLAGLGKNPLVAYVTGSLVILPLLAIIGLRDQWGAWVQTPWQGFLKGLLFTFLVSGITLYFNRKNWIWRS